MAHKSFAVIGLGQFGRSIVKELIDNGMDVIAIDNNEEVAKEVANDLPTTFIADSTDERALKELGIPDVDAAIVAFGDNQEASVLTTVILRELGVKNIIVRVDDDYYVPIMKKLGATEVITPQKAAGTALANRIGNEDFQDYYKLDAKYSHSSLVVMIHCFLMTPFMSLVLLKKSLHLEKQSTENKKRNKQSLLLKLCTF